MLALQAARDYPREKFVEIIRKTWRKMAARRRWRKRWRLRPSASLVAQAVGEGGAEKKSSE